MVALYHQTDSIRIYLGDALATLRHLLSNSVHCVVVSPPYWALRDYGVDGQLGSERTPEEYIAAMVEVFREVRRVLRDDGTLWLNIGDTYAVSKGASTGFDPKDFKGGRTKNVCRPNDKILNGYKPKDMIGIPWMLAFALRADGWYLRSETIWAKKSPMPESVKDRPCKSHEHIFLLTKSPRYFYDLIGSQEDCTGNANSRGHGINPKAKNESFSSSVRDVMDKRNMRTVWPIGPFPLKQAHFAAFPPELVRKCLSAGVSEFGCCNGCGKPYERITKKERFATRPGTGSKVPQNWQTGPGSHKPAEHNTPENHPKLNWGVHTPTKHDLSAEANGYRPTTFGNRDPQRHITRVSTTGSKPACDCLDSIPVPCTVLDPFHGAGTTMKVCERLGLSYVGIELNQTYIDLSIERPAVHFPHEKKKKPKRVKSVDQMELF